MKKEILLILSLIRTTLAGACITDRDCWYKSRPDIHSMYCVESTCQKIVPSGAHCNSPTDCASFFYFGPLACSYKCRVENECEVSGNRRFSSKYCCRPVPGGKECLPDRPNGLNGCSPKQICLMNAEENFSCHSNSLNTWLYGIFLSISGNILINIGINLQKKSYKNKEVHLFGLKVRTMFLGSLVYTLGKSTSFTAYIFGNQSLLASLSAFGLISNSIFAPLINQETFSLKDLMAIILVLAGSSTIISNTNKSERAFSICELTKLYTKPEAISWFCFVSASILGLYFSVKYVEVNSNWGFSNDFFNFMKRDNVFFEDEGFFIKYLMLIFYVLMSALIATFTSLFAKSFGEIIKKTISGENQFSSSMAYLFFTLLLTFTFWQIYWLNRALRHYDSLLTLPIFHALWTILSIVNAGIYFSDFENFTKKQIWGFVSGILIIFVGSGFLISRVSSKDKINVIKMELQISTIKRV